MEKIYEKYNFDEKIKLVCFKGYHETAPDLTIPILNEIVDRFNLAGQR
jgi:hypothetical protein